MTNANECTCPSGDGSLRHPCPAHPAVEQAGWDERAAFFKHLIGRHPANETEIVRVLEHNYSAWKAWQARAALAQPSPKCATCNDQCAPLNANDELMTVAQHAASVARWAEMFNRVEQERDAALARVAELEAKFVELEKQEPVAFRLLNQLGEVMTEWHEGKSPEKFADLCGNPVVDIQVQVAYASPVAQAQHSVPGNAAALVRAEAKKYSLNAAGMLDSGAPEHAQTFAIVQLLSEFDDEEAESHWEAIMAYSDFRTSDALFRAAELLAAAPGKEGV